MVPFPPSNFQPEDFRQYRAEFTIHPTVHDAFSASQVYAGNAGSLWDGGHVQLYPIKGENAYDPISAQHTSYIASEFGSLHGSAQQAYANGILQEIRCEHFGTPSYCFEYGIGCSMPSTSQNMVDLDLDQLRRATSPNSTVSGSEMGSVCKPTTVEQNKLSPEVPVLPPAYFLNLVDVESAEGEPKIWKAGQRKAVTATERALERKRKNNEASRKSRAQRKDRFLMDLREVEFLKIENQRLKDFLIELELVIKEANDALISKFKYRLPTTSSPVS